MKNVIVLIAILSSSISGFAQNFKPTRDSHQGIPSPLVNLLSMMEAQREFPIVINSEKKNGRGFTFLTREQLLDIQLLDSFIDWRWDTLLAGWRPELKITSFQYDSKNNITGYVRQQWNGAAWVNADNFVFSYDANDNEIEQIIQNWNGVTWVNSYHSSSTYDANHNLLEQTDQIWNGSAWENAVRYTYTYDANNNLTFGKIEVWNGSAWENSDQYTNTYDANNNWTSYTAQAWNGSAWEYTGQAIYTYDGNNNQILIVNKSWDGSNWQDFAQNIYTYDGNNNQISDLAQYWDGLAWVSYSLNTYTYDGNHNQLSRLAQSWNGASWVNINQYTYTYDGHNNETSETVQSWDGNAWYLSAKSINSFDIDNTYIWSTSKGYNESGSVAYGDSIHFYYHTVSSIEDVNQSDVLIHVYPNPATHALTFDVDGFDPAELEIEIYNVIGIALFSKEDLSFEIHVSDLPAGQYFYRIRQEQKVIGMGMWVKE